jgi:hypothetical protein
VIFSQTHLVTLLSTRNSSDDGCFVGLECLQYFALAVRNGRVVAVHPLGLGRAFDGSAIQARPWATIPRRQLQVLFFITAD